MFDGPLQSQKKPSAHPAYIIISGILKVAPSFYHLEYRIDEFLKNSIDNNSKC